MRAVRDGPPLGIAAVTAALVTGWVSILMALVGGSTSLELHTLATAVQILLAVSLISIISGFIPALIFLLPCFRFAHRFQGRNLRFALAGGFAGLVWFAIAWPTRPGSAVWSALVGLSDAPFNLLWLFTGQLLFAGINGTSLDALLVLAPVTGGTAAGAVYGRLRRT